MTDNSKTVTIFGGSGFLGRYITRRMARAGWRVRVAVRRPYEAGFVRPYGTVGQVEPILANVRNEDSVRAAIAGADAVINCVGILQENRRQRFEAIHRDAAGRIARIAAEQGVSRLVHISALGADADSPCRYAATKAEGEAQVLSAFPAAVILRASVIFGNEDGFFNRFAGMARFGPILPIFGANTLFQPVYVDDVARAAVQAAAENTPAGTYELGGPDTESLRDLVQRVLSETRYRRLVLGLPYFVARITGAMIDLVCAMWLGIIPNKILTADQARQLQIDNVVSEGALTFSDLGIEPTAMETVLPEYLYQYRPHGQYAEITESAGNLETVRNSQSTIK